MTDRQRQGNIALLAVAALLAVQLACGSGEVYSSMDRLNCTTKGGTWRTEVDINGEVEEWCDTTVKPTEGNTEPQTTGDCLVPHTGYEWSYENKQSSSGTGGTTCNGVFVFHNSGEDVVLILYENWDNNAMHSEGWHDYHVAAGETFEKRVSRTLYSDGVYTFDRVEQYVVLRDLPGCFGGVPDPTTAAEWAEAAEIIDELPCP